MTAFDVALGVPYEKALRAAGSLTMHDLSGRRRVRLDIERFLADPDENEAGLVRDLPGPILDIGCGPGRMLRAARAAGHGALGVDVSHAAVTIARTRGLPVMLGSVFDPLPDEGAWGAALLLDGNIGIGGDPAALLDRCAVLLRGGGRLVVETHRAARRDHRFHGVLRAGTSGPPGTPFAWAEVGRLALRRRAAASGFLLVREWRAGGRRFSEFARGARV